jgi:hypothetical protein
MDLNSNAFRIVQSLTKEKPINSRSEAARVAGKVGGRSRAKRLSPEERQAIAVKANQVRWQKRIVSNRQIENELECNVRSS